MISRDIHVLCEPIITCIGPELWCYINIRISCRYLCENQSPVGPIHFRINYDYSNITLIIDSLKIYSNYWTLVLLKYQAKQHIIYYKTNNILLYYVYVLCVCVRACARARARVCVCLCVM